MMAKTIKEVTKNIEGFLEKIGKIEGLKAWHQYAKPKGDCSNIAIHVTPPDGEEDDEFVPQNPPARARRKLSTPLSSVPLLHGDSALVVKNGEEDDEFSAQGLSARAHRKLSTPLSSVPLLDADSALTVRSRRSSPNRSLSAFDRTKRRFSTMVTGAAAAAVSRRLSATIGWYLATPTQVKPHIVRQGRALCMQYIKCQIRRTSIASKKIVMKRLQTMLETECGEEATMNLEGGVLAALRALGAALERKRPDAFRQVARQATRAPTTMLRSDTALAELTLALARRITRDNITWSKMAAVFCICGALAREAAEAADGEPAVELVVAPAAAIADLLHEEPGSWVASNGGWQGLIDRLRASERDQRSEKNLRVIISMIVVACFTLLLLRWIIHIHPTYYA